MDIQQFIEEFSADLRGQQNSLLLSLFIEKSEFKHIPDYFLPIRAELSGNKCIFSYTDKFISMEYGNQAHVMLMEIYRVLYRHPQREQALVENERDKMIAHIASWMTINQFVDNNFTPVTDRTYADSITFENWLEQGPDTHPHIKNPVGPGADLASTFWAVIDILDDLEEEQEQQQEQDQESEEQSEPEKNQDYFNQSGNGDSDESDADSQEGSNEDQGESGQDQKQKEGEDDSNESNDSESSPGKGSDDGEQFYQELIQDAERHGEKPDSDHPVHGRSAGQQPTDNVVEVQTKHSPTASRAWNRIVKWEMRKRKRETMQFSETWAFRNPRMFSMNKKLALPYEKYILDEKAPEFWVFLDVSQSCERLKPSFERILESIPKNFDVRPFVFADYCVPYNMETKSYSNAGYGTSFCNIEHRIQNVMKDEGIPYPKYVIVITDGHGGQVYPEYPERWMFIASDYGSAYKRAAYQVVDYTTRHNYTGKQYMSTNCINRGESRFMQTLHKRKKHLPLFVSYLEFEQGVDITYGEGESYRQT